MNYHYYTLALMVNDQHLNLRLIACAAVEGIPDAGQFITDHIWEFMAMPEWAAKYQYALDTGVADPGLSLSVISDEDILSAVQLVAAAS